MHPPIQCERRRGMHNTRPIEPAEAPGFRPFARLNARTIRSHALVASLAAMTVIGAVASSPAPKTIVAFGDSYFSGFGVEPEQSFPAQLERALRARGHNARVINSGVPGETIEDGLRRLDATLAA